jgi:hypothetical protein
MHWKSIEQSSTIGFLRRPIPTQGGIMGKNTRIVLGMLILLFLAGCGRGRINAKGRLFMDGKQFHPGENEFVRLVFVSADEGKVKKEGEEASFIAAFNSEDGTFQVTGAQGDGLPPGKYRVCVEVMKLKKDLLNGQFNAQNSPFVCTVATGKEDLTFDLAKPAAAP